LETARGKRRGTAERWFLIAAGAATISFALSFCCRRLSDDQTGAAEHLLHLSSYFGFCAIFMLWLAFRVHGQGVSQSSPTELLSSFPSPRHAH
jgi:hypothetical protein